MRKNKHLFINKPKDNIRSMWTLVLTISGTGLPWRYNPNHFPYNFFVYLCICFVKIKSEELERDEVCIRRKKVVSKVESQKTPRENDREE